MKRIYFASDLHFGLDMDISSKDRERMFAKWMDSIKNDCAGLYLLGDVFDYWFEYTFAVPKGFTRVLGKIAEFTDAGIPVVIFTGNHDIWMHDYLVKEVGAQIETKDRVMEIMGKRFFLGHGDQLGDPSLGFRFISAFFRNKFCEWLYKWIHPDITTRFAHWWSRHNRMKKLNKGTEGSHYRGESGEYLVSFAKKKEATEHHDYYLFGHRHIELDLMISPCSRVAIIGNWIWSLTFAVFDGENFYLDNYMETDPTQDDRASCTDLSNVC